MQQKGIIAGIPIDELQEIVFSQAFSDDFLYNKIMTKYAPITPQHMIRLKQQVHDIGYRYSDRGGFVDYYRATDYTDALNSLLDENEIIDFKILLAGMIYKKTSSQYSFHTEKSIKFLRKVEN